jgi:hypothetical protein
MLSLVPHFQIPRRAPVLCEDQPGAAYFVLISYPFPLQKMVLLAFALRHFLPGLILHLSFAYISADLILLIGLQFNPEYGGDMFLRNVGLSSRYMALQP